MEKFAILARVEAKPGKENEVLEFLKSALPLAEGEPGTVRWYALQIGPSTFGIFDTFGTTDARDAHLNGEIAKALMANASELLAKEPVLEMVDLLAVKEATEHIFLIQLNGARHFPGSIFFVSFCERLKLC